MASRPPNPGMAHVQLVNGSGLYVSPSLMIVPSGALQLDPEISFMTLFILNVYNFFSSIAFLGRHEKNTLYILTLIPYPFHTFRNYVDTIFVL